MEDRQTTSSVAEFIGSSMGKVSSFLNVQLNMMKEIKVGGTYREVINWLNTSISNINEKISLFISRVASEVKVVPAQVKDEIIRMSKQTEDAINKTIEKGTSLIKELTESLAASIKEGKKKYIEK
jgi:hypothetical protein